MKNLKYLLKYLICFVFTFVLIYLFVFLGGWRLFESKDPILIEIGASVVIAFVIFGVTVALDERDERAKELEKRIKALEDRLFSEDKEE